MLGAGMLGGSMSQQNKQSEQTAVSVQKKQPVQTPQMGALETEQLAGFDVPTATSVLDIPESNANHLKQVQLMRMQKMQGNAYVQRFLQNRAGSAARSQPAMPALPKINNPVQTKLSVNEPDDQYEKEADSVAEAVMRSTSTSTPPAEEEDSPEIQRASRDPMAGATVSDDLESNINSMKGGGSPLPSEERTFFESRMGADFSDVRIHTGAQATETSSQLNAKAYTTGTDIAFNDGEYQPGTDSGRELIAHELTHVVQQGGAVQTKLQRREDSAVEGEEADTPTPEEKAEAEAAAIAADARAAEARTTSQGNTTDSQAQGEQKRSEGEGPKAEANASRAEGPVNDGEVKAQEVAIQEQAITLQEQAMGEMGEQTAVTQSAVAEAQAFPLASQMVNGTVEPIAVEGGGGDLESATALAEAKTESAFAESENSPDKAPDSAEADPTYNTVKQAAVAVGAEQQVHEPAQAEADQAQSAAVSPVSEKESKAQGNQVGEMEQAETPEFDAATFKQALMDRIETITPSTSEEADNFDENGGAGAIKGDVQGEVSSQKELSSTPIEEATTATPDTGAVEDKPVTPLQSNDPGAVPGPIAAESGVPKSRGQGEFETPLQSGSQNIDQQMADAEVTEEQLANSNEPEFTDALDAKGEAQTAVQEAPQAYRAFEQEQISGAEAEAAAVAEESLAAMHGERTSGLASVDTQQGETKTQDEAKRAEIAEHITGIYDRTKTEVDTILNGLDGDVNTLFDEGATKAAEEFETFVEAKMEAYKQRRYGGMFGWAKWIEDKLTSMPEEVNAFYVEGRNLYLREMEAVIDKIAAVISTTLAKAKAEVAKGKQEIQEYVDQIPSDLQSIGQEAAQAVQSKFDQLEETISNKQNELIDTLAQKYQENLQAIDTRIEEMKEANKGLIDKAIDAVGGVLKTILELKNMLMEVLASAADAVMLIIKDPIGFIGNLLSAVGQGLKNFASNILTHLQTGLVEWLTGTMGEAGIQMPEDIFSLQGILDLVLQVLGLTWENFRSRAAGVFGEKVISALETGFEIFMIVKDEGLVGLWEWIQEKIATLKDEVIEGIKEMIATEVVEAGIQWLISMLGGPAGAFIKAAKMIYDVIMWFVNNASQVMALVQSIIDSVTEIASGNLEAAAQYVEDSLARFVPVAIGFLASLLGLGDLSKKVRKVIDKIQAPVNDAIDYVLEMVKGFVQKVAKALGLGGENDSADGDIGEEIPFSAGDENHKLYVKVQGSSATLMVASEPMSVEQRLADWTGRLQDIPETKRGEAKGLINQAQGQLNEAEESADFLAEKKEAKKTVDDGDKIQQEQNELEWEQRSLADVLRLLFEMFGDAMPELEGDAKIKFDQIMADQHIPEGIKAQFQDELFVKLSEGGEGADQYGIMKGVAAGGDYFTKGPEIPASELKDKGGMTRVIPLKTIWADNLEAGYKAQFGTFEAWLEALGEDGALFNPSEHLDGGSTVPGRYASAWWAPRGSQQGNTMAELIEELSLNPASYEGGCVRVTVSPEASGASEFKKPTALDGIFFMEFEPAPANSWGVTGGGSLEAVAPQIPMSDVTEKEFLPANLPEGESAETALKKNEEPLLEDGKITKENAEQAASTTAQDKDVQITVQDGGETWDYNIQRMAQTPQAPDIQKLIGTSVDSLDEPPTGYAFFEIEGLREIRRGRGNASNPDYPPVHVDVDGNIQPNTNALYRSDYSLIEQYQEAVASIDMEGDELPEILAGSPDSLVRALKSKNKPEYAHGIRKQMQHLVQVIKSGASITGIEVPIGERRVDYTLLENGEEVMVEYKHWTGNVKAPRRRKLTTRLADQLNAYVRLGPERGYRKLRVVFSGFYALDEDSQNDFNDVLEDIYNTVVTINQELPEDQKLSFEEIKV